MRAKMVLIEKISIKLKLSLYKIVIYFVLIKCSPLNVHHWSKYFYIIDIVGIDILPQ